MNQGDKTNEGAARPRITEKEVSWHEAVAAHKARKEFLSREQAEDGMMLQMLTVAAVERVKVGPWMLEPYSLATSMVLQEMESPFEVGGREPTTEDIAIAVIAFGERELLESLVANYGAEEARRLLRSGPLPRKVLAAMTAPVATAVRRFLEDQFTAINRASGRSVEDDAAEAAVATAEAAAGNG